MRSRPLLPCEQSISGNNFFGPGDPEKVKFMMEVEVILDKLHSYKHRVLTLEYEVFDQRDHQSISILKIPSTSSRPCRQTAGADGTVPLLNALLLNGDERRKSGGKQRREDVFFRLFCLKNNVTYAQLPRLSQS